MNSTFVCDSDNKHKRRSFFTISAADLEALLLLPSGISITGVVHNMNDDTYQFGIIGDSLRELLPGMTAVQATLSYDYVNALTLDGDTVKVRTLEFNQ